MTIRRTGRVLSPLILLVLGLSFGCAQQMKSVKTEAATKASATAQIQSIKIADDGSSVEIVSDKPIVYTYYMLESPPRVIVDIAQTAPGNQSLPMIVNTAGVKQLDVSRHEFGSGVLSRIDIALNSKTEISASLDQKDKKRLILLIPVAATVNIESEKQSPGVETVQISEPKPILAENSAGEAQAVKAEPEVSTVEPVSLSGSSLVSLKAGERGLTAIKKDNDGLLLETSAEPESYKAFKLTQPDRLVIDIHKTRSALSSNIVAINSFNLGNARIGSSPDKLRIVFDATGIIPRYSVTKIAAGLKVAFEGTVNRPVEIFAAETAAKNESLSQAKKPVNEEHSSPSTQEPERSSKTDEVSPVPTPPTVDEPKSPPPLPVISSGQPPTAAASEQLPAGVVSAIEFTQIDEVSRITIKTTGGCMAGDPVKSPKGYLLAIKGCRLSANQQRPLNTSAFNSEIQNIAPYSVKGGVIPQTRIAVNLRHPIPNSVQKDGNDIQWDFKEPVKLKPAVKKIAVQKEAVAAVEPPARDALETDMTEVKVEPLPGKSKVVEEAFLFDKASQSLLRPGKKYTGRKVTLEFSDADIKKIFQLLAEVSNQNILVSDDVTGTISLKLVNVPWDQALDVILENKGLGMQKEGNIVQIRPRSKMKSLDDEAVEMRLTEEKKMPLSTVIFDINFAGLGDMETQFKNLKSKRSDSSISIDTRTNKIIVVDIDPNISKMRKLLEELDVPEKQVMIEARIVEASSSFARDIGVKWGFGYSDGSASVGNINAAAGSMGGVVSSVVSTAATSGLATGVSFGKLLSNFQLDMRLSAAASIGQIKIVSTPKVMTVNNKPAKISQGQMIPYQNTSSTDGATTEFIEAALSLEVTPHITADGSVNMKIKASNNTAGVGNPPPINKKEATTELVVKDGETTVIGGIYVDSETEGDAGVPYLADIPFFGNLFKSSSKNKVKNEMLIFITPRILN